MPQGAGLCAKGFVVRFGFEPEHNEAKTTYRIN